MPPPESVRERVAVGLQAALAAISATAQPTKYWYTPTRVLRVDIHDSRYLRAKLPDDTDIDVLYLLQPGDNFPNPETTGEYEVRAEFWLLAAKKWQPASQDPYHLHDNPPLKETLQNRLARDVRMRLAEVRELGGLALSVEVTDESYITIEDSFPWAPIEMRILVQYSHRTDAM